MDTQILATVSNIFQILGVLWILLFGSRTVFETLKNKVASSRPAPSPSGVKLHIPPSPYGPDPVVTSNTSSYKKWKWTDIFILFTTSNTSSREYKQWNWTGIFILFIASVAWVAFKANVLHIGLLWYEVLVIGFVPSGIWIQKTGDDATPSLIVGNLCLGPLIAVAAYFIIYPFHLPTLLCALIVFIAAFVLLLGYLLLVSWLIQVSNPHVSHNVVGHLIVIDGGPSNKILPGTSFDLLPETTIGRSPTNTIQLPDSSISTVHTRLWFRNRTWYVQDEGGGTYLNNQPAFAPLPVRSGDIIQVGFITFKLRQ